jgi:chromosome segregation ATPase
MSIFENISKKVTETARAAAKKSGDIVEVTKLNINISAEEDKIKKTFTDIGKIVYDSYAKKEDMADNFRELCKQVESYEKNIEDMKKKILELRKIKICPECDTELDIEMAYCHKCGEEQEVPQPECRECEAADDEEKDLENDKKDDSDNPIG